MTEHAGSEPRVTDPRLPGFTCLNCGGQVFTRREVKLNTSGMSFAGLDWANKSGQGYICNSCAFMHVFAPDAIEDPNNTYFGQ